MSLGDELQGEQKLPLADDADTEVDLEPSQVRASTPRPEVDLSVTVMQALRTLTQGYEPPSPPHSRP